MLFRLQEDLLARFTLGEYERTAERDKHTEYGGSKMRLTDSEGDALVRLARSAVETYLERGKTIGLQDEQSESFKRKAKVFVTIFTEIPSERTRILDLRGCIGYLNARLSLARATIHAAITAATADPRFPPMKDSELKMVIFEVNILSEFSRLKASEPTAYPSMIKTGVDGLVISKGEYRGLLLPGVPVEWGWAPEDFLTQCSIKAGLHPDAWLDSGTKVYKFQSEIFRETEPSGRIQRVNLMTEIPTLRSTETA